MDGIVHVFCLEGAGGDSGFHALDMLLAVLLGPAALPVLVNDVHHHVPVSLGSQPADDGILCDEVALCQDERRSAHRTGGDDGPFDEFRLFVQDDGIPAVFVGVVVVDVDDVRTDGFIPGTTRRIAVTDSQEGKAASGDEVRLFPLCQGLLFPVEVNNPAVGLQIGTVGRQQPHSGILRGADHQEIVFLAGEHQEEFLHHGDGGLGQLAGPTPDLEPLGIPADSVDGFLLEGCKGAAGVVREEILHPFYRMLFQVSLLFGLFGRSQPLRRGRFLDVVLELLPLKMCSFINLLHGSILGFEESIPQVCVFDSFGSVYSAQPGEECDAGTHQLADT